MTEGYDFSWGRPGPAAILANGRSFVCRYLGPDRFGGKAITKAELDGYLNAGIAVVLNYEGSGQDTTSYANGVADATYANAQAAALGYPNAVIYFSNDKASISGLVDYMHGVASVIGLARTGLYAGVTGIQAVKQAGAAAWYWQTYAWSGLVVATGVHIYQYSNNHLVNGSSVDYDRALVANFGQIVGAEPADNPPPVPAPVVGYNASTWSTAQIQAALNKVDAAGLAVDGAYGPATTAAVHAFEIKYHLTVDIGIAGPQVVAKLAALIKVNPVTNLPHLVIDGKEGPLTTEAEQRALHVTADGIRGPVTIKAEQNRTGATEDGFDGPDTNRHLQAYLNKRIKANLVVDGIRGPLTVRALQRALDAGEF